MKKTIIILLSLCAAVTMSFVMSDNGKAGKNGSPGENTCAESGCHTGNPLNSSNGSVVISAPTMTNWQYVPGQVYPVSVTVTHQGRSLFGLGFEALLSSGANGGTLTVTNTSQTQIKSASVNGNVRTNIVHKLNGGASANAHTFTFNWTAPAANAGAITFYTAGNAADGDGNESGDFIYTATRTVTPVTTGVEEVTTSEANISIFPNPVSDLFTVSYDISEPGDVQLRLINLEGKQLLVKNIIGQVPGHHSEEIVPEQMLPAGIYFMEMRTAGSAISKKILVM